MSEWRGVFSSFKGERIASIRTDRNSVVAFTTVAGSKFVYWVNRSEWGGETIVVKSSGGWAGHFDDAEVDLAEGRPVIGLHGKHQGMGIVYLPYAASVPSLVLDQRRTKFFDRSEIVWSIS